MFEVSKFLIISFIFCNNEWDILWGFFRDNVVKISLNINFEWLLSGEGE